MNDQGEMTAQPEDGFAVTLRTSGDGLQVLLRGATELAESPGDTVHVEIRIECRQRTFIENVGVGALLRSARPSGGVERVLDVVGFTPEGQHREVDSSTRSVTITGLRHRAA